MAEQRKVNEVQAASMRSWEVMIAWNPPVIVEAADEAEAKRVAMAFLNITDTDTAKIGISILGPGTGAPPRHSGEVPAKAAAKADQGHAPAGGIHTSPGKGEGHIIGVDTAKGEAVDVAKVAADLKTAHAKDGPKK
jgi:hypothetical protein